MNADVVVGQDGPLDNASNQGGGSPQANTLSDPYDSIIVGTRLVIVDQFNNRVLIYNSIPTTNNAAADVVIGQSDFVSRLANQGGSASANTLSAPSSVSSDGTSLLIADTNNNRVLVYNTIPTTNNAAADVVIGQSDFVSTQGNQGGSVAANTLSVPLSVEYDGSRVLVSDSFNNRVLIYNSIPASNNASANVVVGQSDLISNSSGTTDSTLNFPNDAYSDGTSLFIADSANNRVLIYNTIPVTNGVAADVVIGQSDFVSGSPNQGGSASASTMSNPRSVVYDGSQLFVADTNNNRVLVHNSVPVANNAAADIVIGQSDFVSGSSNQGGSVSANTLGQPERIDSDGTIVTIADSSNNRVLLYDLTDSSPNTTAEIPTTTATDSSIIDTEITVVDPDGILPENVEVDSSTTAGYDDFQCTAASPTEVDCTIEITSSGDLVIGATDELGNPGTQLIGSYTITDTADPNVTPNVPTTSTTDSRITDTTFTVSDPDGIDPENVVVDPSTTAGYDNFMCIAVSQTEVECTVDITSSGDFIITATDDNGDVTTRTIGTYTITDTTAPNLSVKYEDVTSTSGVVPVEIIAEDPDGVTPSDIATSATAGFDALECTQVSASEVVCTTFIISSGDFDVSVTDGSLETTNAPTVSFTITEVTTPLYRFWSKQNRTHFYTRSLAERDKVIADFTDEEWLYEGEAYDVFEEDAPGLRPVYRFWSKQNKAHFYTASRAERDKLIDTYTDFQWKYEGVAYYVYEDSFSASAPVYRFYSKQNRAHFFTDSLSERDKVIDTFTDFQWKYEGTAWEK
jgi:sugar lactone lactonase YvrE